MVSQTMGRYHVPETDTGCEVKIPFKVVLELRIEELKKVLGVGSDPMLHKILDVNEIIYSRLYTK